MTEYTNRPEILEPDGEKEETFHQYTEDDTLVCINAKHLAEGRPCATPDTFGLLQSVTGLLREAELVEALAKNHAKARPELPDYYRSIQRATEQARASLALTETLLNQLWRDEQ